MFSKAEEQVDRADLIMAMEIGGRNALSKTVLRCIKKM